MYGTLRDLVKNGALAGLVFVSAAAFAGSTDASPERDRAGTVAPVSLQDVMPQFYSETLGRHWYCGTPAVGNTRASIDAGAAWNIVDQTCFGVPNIIVPYRIVRESWFELDDEGNPLDPDYTPPDDDDPDVEDPIESMVVEDEYFDVIFEAMDVIEDLCNVRFALRDPFDSCYDGRPWIRIQQSTDERPGFEGNFSSSVGMLNDPLGQIIVMRDWSVPVMVHELMHALGFFHEQQRSDRDTFVQINFNNIPAFFWNQFEKLDPGSEFGDYDLFSIMHYSRFAFSANGQPTIVMQPGFENFSFLIGAAELPSPGDRTALQAMYGAPAFDPCIGDVTGDGFVNVLDLRLFIDLYIARDLGADLNDDGFVDVLDFLIFIGSYQNRRCADSIVIPSGVVGDGGFGQTGR